MDKAQKLEEKMADAHGQLQTTIMQSLYLIGNKIAKKRQYKNLNGIEAVYYYLVQKHNWTPSQVRSMNMEDLAFCLEEEKL